MPSIPEISHDRTLTARPALWSAARDKRGKPSEQLPASKVGRAAHISNIWDASITGYKRRAYKYLVTIWTMCGIVCVC